MAAIQNDITKALQATVPRYTVATDRGMFVTPSTAIFKLSGDGSAASPGSITFQATLLNLPGTVAWSWTDGMAPVVNGNSITLDYSQFSAVSGTITATITVDGQTYTQIATVTKLSDGTSGTAASYVVISSTGQVFSRATSTAAFSPASLTLTAAPFGGAATYQWQYWTGSAWANVPSGGTSATYAVASGDFTDSRTYRVQATINGAVCTDEVTLVQVTGGTNGINAITGFLTNESAALAATSAGTVSDFSGASGVFDVYDGITNQTGNAAVTYSVASQTGCTVAITSAGAYSVSAMTADSATAVLQAIYGGVTIQKTLSLAKAKAGAVGVRGTINISAATSGSVWSDSEANAAIAAAGYGTHQTRDVVTLYNQSAKFTDTRFWDGNAWQEVAQVINGNLLVQGSVNTSALAADAVTTDKLAAQAITASKLVVGGSPDNIVPDPKFKDLVWWNRVGYGVGDWSAGNTSWKLGASLYIGANGGVRRVTDTQSFSTTPGATCLAEFQISLSSDFNGNFSLFLATGDGASSMGAPNVGTFTNLFGFPIQFNGSSPKTFQTYNATITLSSSSANQKAHLTIIDEITAGTIEIGSVSITRMTDNSLVPDASIGSAKIIDLRTANYAEDGSGNPTAGVKLASAGTALKVASDNLQVGTRIFSDYWFRLLQGIDGNIANGRVIWRGNNDISTRGGAPNIACLSITPIASQVLNSNFQQIYHQFKITPSSYSAYTDNLDAMQQIHIQLFGTTSSTSPFIDFYWPCPSRSYDGNQGAAQASWSWGWRFSGAGATPGVTQQYETNGVFTGCIRATLINSYGPSAAQDFASGSANGTALGYTTISGSTPPPGGGSGGGSGGGGGACPAPWVKVRLISGKEVLAGDLHDGARVAAVNDNTMQVLPNGGTVRDLSTIWAHRYRVKLTNGEATEWSENHRFYVLERGWVHVQHLRAGDHIMGQCECVVESVIAAGKGQVVSFRVEGAGTYFAGDMLCHNLKQYL